MSRAGDGSGGGAGMSHPGDSGSDMSGSSQQQQQQPNGQRIEAIKQYYNQLCTNLRHIVNQLNAPDLTPQRKAALLQQQEQVQKSLQEFTEKVLKPLAAAANSGGGSQKEAPVATFSTQPHLGPPPAAMAPVHPRPQQPIAPIVKQKSPPPPPPQAPPPPVATAPSAPPTHTMTPPVMFQNAPPAAKQVILAIQKQTQLIYQQQLLFGQKILSKNFDSSLNYAHQESSNANFEDRCKGAEGICLVTTAEEQGKSVTSALKEQQNRNSIVGRSMKEVLGEIVPRLPCTPNLEDALLKVADEFIDNLGSFACQLAANRKLGKLCKKDMELAAERLYGITLPGNYRSTLLSASVKKLTKRPTVGASSNPHLVRMAQLKKFFTQNPHL